jgi:leucyl-tRNA synthetase
LDLSIEEIKDIVMQEQRTKDQINGAIPKKIIVVPNKIINIVV